MDDIVKAALKKWPNVASAYITGISVGILVRSPYYWPYALTSAIAITSKYVIRYRGRHIFNPEVYYFNEIPTHIEAPMVVLVNLGAVAIAVIFSILPALRAAMLHPVRALRYE